MSLSIEQIKQLILPDSIVTPSTDGQPTWGMYNTGYNLYNLIEEVVDDLDVGTGTLLFNTLVDNLNGTYTWTPISGPSFLINTHAISNPINSIAGMTAKNVQEALQELYTAMFNNLGFSHPAVTMDAFSNTALNIDLLTQVAILDLSAAGSFPFASNFGGVSSIQDWFNIAELYTLVQDQCIGVGPNGDMGTFTGSIITDNVSIKQALQELENAYTVVATASISTYVDNGDGTWDLDNNSLVTPSAVTIDTRADVLPLAPGIQFVHLPLTQGGLPVVVNTTTVQEALEEIKVCCTENATITGPDTTTGTVATTGLATNSGLGLLSAEFTIVDGFVEIEALLNARKPVTTAAGTNPAFTINTAAPGVDKFDLDLSASGSYVPGANVLITPDNIEGAIDIIETELVKTRVQLIGVGATDSDLGAFTGVTITSGLDVKAILQELETAVEAVSHTTSIMTDNADGTYTHNDGLGVLVSIDTNALSSVLSVVGITALNVQDGLAELLATQVVIQTALGTTSGDMGTFTGTTIPDNNSVKQALQFLETAVEAVTYHTTANNGLLVISGGGGDVVRLGGPLINTTTVTTTGFVLDIGTGTVGFHVEDTLANIKGTGAEIETGAILKVKDPNFISGGVYPTTGQVLQIVDKTTAEAEFSAYSLPLGLGTPNQVLATDGVGGSYWKDVGGAVVQKTFADSPYAASWVDHIEPDCTGGNVIINYPSAIANNGNTISILRADNTVNTLTAVPNGAETINGLPNKTIPTQWNVLLVKSNGTNLTWR